MKRLTLSSVFLAILGFCFLYAQDDTKPNTAKDRFDYQVREHIFQGFNGDDEELAKGIQICEEAIKKNPKHAEALVWRGAARVYQAGELFAAKKPAEALPLWTSGLKDMDDAVKYEPENPGVRIPRAAVLLPAAREAPPAMGKPLLEKVEADFEHIYEQQKDHLEKLGTHPRGELRMGLADVYRLQGKADKSTEQLKAVIQELPKSKYAERAEQWLAAKPDAKLEHTCIGCHRK